jgi:phosphatidylglycerophosphate synthase
VLWLAHALTLSRVPIAITLAWTYGETWTSVALIAIAAATDAADGNLARYLQRRGHTQPAIGGWLDPLVDKIFVAIVLVIIWVQARDVLLIALVGAREIVMVPLVAIYLARRGRTDQLHADPIGKAATIAQFVALGVAVAKPAWAVVPAIAAAGLGLAAVAHYVARELRATPGR